MVRWPCLVIWAWASQGGCGGARDVDLYIAALAPQEEFETGVALCQRMAVTSVAQECQLAVMEVHDRLELADCQRLPLGLWHDECQFQLAERQWRAGLVDDAIHTCDGTRFGRACQHHLLWALGEELATRDSSEVWAALSPFATSPLVPDAERLFWRDRFRRRLAAGRPLDPAECARVEQPAACEEAFRQQLTVLLDGQWRARGAELCAALEGQDEAVPLNPGQPAWVANAQAEAVVAHWRRGHCQDAPSLLGGVAPTVP